MLVVQIRRWCKCNSVSSGGMVFHQVVEWHSIEFYNFTPLQTLLLAKIIF